MEDPITKVTKRLRNPDQIFDLITMSNWMAGNLNQKIPVDASRKAFERIKKLLAAKKLTP